MGSDRSLLDLPHEVLQNILENGDPKDLGRLSSTCRTLHSFIQNNRLLFKELYLSHFDDPRKRAGSSEPDWETELLNVVRLHNLLVCPKIERKTENFTSIGGTIVWLLETAVTNCSNPKSSPSRNITFLTEKFQQSVNVNTLLCCSSLFERAGDVQLHVPANTEKERQLSAKLHCLYGVPVYATTDDGIATHPFARGRVYDLRRYTQGSLWGPFVDDGSQRVDWEKMEAIMTDLSYNLNVFHERTNGLLPRIWVKPWAGASPYSFIPLPITKLEKQPDIPLDAQDPYGISGTWMRVVCFLHYAELFAFNFAYSPPAPEENREPIDTEEATRLIGMKLKVTKIEPPGKDDGQSLPVVYFHGNSRSLHSAWDPNANSGIRGMVRLTPEGEVRWTTFSIYGGEERWRSEGIQIGGVRSARGVLGNWFDKDYDEHGPAGPTAFWKVCDEVNDDTSTLFHF